MNEFTRRCGLALVLGAIVLILTNAILSPLQPIAKGEAVLRTSGIYFVRLSAALVCALLLLVGGLGLHLAQRSVSGSFGKLAFLVSFIGNGLLIAIEWANLFVLRPVAQTTPETLKALNRSSLMTAGFVSGAGLFMLGWLLLAISVWRSRVFPRWAAVATAAGLIAIPALGVTPLGQGGQIMGNVIFGLGLLGLGRALGRAA